MLTRPFVRSLYYGDSAPAAAAAAGEATTGVTGGAGATGGATVGVGTTGGIMGIVGCSRLALVYNIAGRTRTTRAMMPRVPSRA